MLSPHFTFRWYRPAIYVDEAKSKLYVHFLFQMEATMARRILGLDILRTSVNVDHRFASWEVSKDEAAQALGISSKTIERFYDQLESAMDVINRVGPEAGMSDLADELKTSRKALARFFKDDRGLRLVYKMWASNSLLIELYQEAAEFKSLATSSRRKVRHFLRDDLFRHSVHTIFSQLHNYLDIYGLYGVREIDAELRDRMIAAMRSWIAAMSLRLEFGFADLDAAAVECVDILTGPFPRADGRRLPERDKGRVEATGERTEDANEARDKADLAADFVRFKAVFGQSGGRKVEGQSSHTVTRKKGRKGPEADVLGTVAPQ